MGVWKTEVTSCLFLLLREGRAAGDTHVCGAARWLHALPVVGQMQVAHSWCQADTSLECSCAPLVLTTFTELHVCAVTDISFEEQ